MLQIPMSGPSRPPIYGMATLRRWHKRCTAQKIPCIAILRLVIGKTECKWSMTLTNKRVQNRQEKWSKQLTMANLRISRRARTYRLPKPIRAEPSVELSNSKMILSKSWRSAPMMLPVVPLGPICQIADAPSRKVTHNLKAS